MSLQLVKCFPEESFAQKIAKLNLYAELTGKTMEECVRDALYDYVDVVVEAKLSQIEKYQGIAV